MGVREPFIVQTNIEDFNACVAKHAPTDTTVTNSGGLSMMAPDFTKEPKPTDFTSVDLNLTEIKEVDWKHDEVCLAGSKT